MIEPTVGRVVWVRGRPGSVSGDQPEVGFITYVHSLSCINVAGFDANGRQFFGSSVMLKQGDPELDSWQQGYQGWHAEWMPYQKGQAAKTEALERAAAATGG